MDFYLYDFDAQFQKDLRQWMRKHRGDFANMDEMEQAMPEMYEQWLETPAKWLDGEKPGHYYEKFTDGEVLVKGMLRYLVTGMGLPAPLMDRVVELKDTTEDLLLGVLTGEYEVPARADAAEAKMLAIHLLSEQGSSKAKDEFIRIVRGASGQGEDELADAAMQGLQTMAQEWKDDILAAFEGASSSAKLLFCMALSDVPGDDRIAEKIRELFRNEETEIAISAGLVGHYGLEDMLPELERATRNPDLNYMQYLELTHAIEELGGEVYHERDFSGDPDYEALQGMSE